MKRPILILGFILIFPFFLFPQAKLTIEEVFTNRALYGKSYPQVTWVDGGAGYVYTKMNTETMMVDIQRVNTTTGEESVFIAGNSLIPANSVEPISVMNYELSEDGKFVLFTGVVPSRSLKSGGDFYVYNLEQKKIILAVESEAEQVNAHISPDGSRVAFVRDNNLYSVEAASGKETQLTFDGNKNILNGVFDWVYEEEFSIINGYEWSPDSKTIAFWRLDQTFVQEFTIAKWDSLYLNPFTMKYPKPGTPNSKVYIGTVSASGGKVTWMDLGTETDIYIPRIAFTRDPKKLTIQRLNRLQNTLDLLMADTESGVTTLLFTETDPCWVDVFDDLYFLKTADRFIWSSERDGFKHLYLYDLKGNVVQQLTKGEYEVNDFKSIDEENGILYYTSNQRGVLYNDLYCIDVRSGKSRLLTDETGYHRVSLSPDNRFFIDRYSSAAKMPSTFLVSSDGKKLRTLAESDQSLLKVYNLTVPEFITFKTTDGVELNMKIMKPADFDPNKKYPVLFDNYSGPGSQTVFDQWGSIMYLYHQVLVQNGVIVCSIDNRGTGGRGKAFKNLVYKNLGNYEIQDHIEAVQYLKTLPYIDGSRIGIWGWSYGGYVSALAIMKAPDFFKLAVAVAPVTHFKFYDTIYTERFMSLPSLNPEGYENGSVLSYTQNLKGKFLLIHGTADDNVHFQNSVALVSKLIADDKQFQTMFYPEKDHGIYGGKTRHQLFTLMKNYILENL